MPQIAYQHYIAKQQLINIPQKDKSEIDKERIDGINHPTKIRERNSDGVEVYCICRLRTFDTFMICCDNCEEWYHGGISGCVQVTPEQSKNIKHWICPKCRGQWKEFLKDFSRRLRTGQIKFAVKRNTTEQQQQQQYHNTMPHFQQGISSYYPSTSLTGYL
ncbi:MAG: hypothetical protein EZS28_054548, partial [Streblomastix strix]